MEAITIRDVAKHANVSISTVSRAINNPDAVTTEKRVRVENAIRELGYIPNAAARELVVGSTRQIGVLVSDIRNVYITTLVTSFVQRMEDFGYSVSINITGSDREREKRFIEQMLQKRVEAVVMYGRRKMDSKYYKWMAKRLGNIPLIKVGPGCDNYYYRIYTDEEQGAFLATEYLIHMGHRRIGFINGELQYDSYYYKQIGYQKAMSQYDVLVHPGYVCNIAGDGSLNTDADGAVRQILSMPERPTALLLAGDQYAWNVYKVAQEFGLQIPKDLSVIGYSNSSFSVSMCPALTTIDQLPVEMGEKVAEHLMSILDRSAKTREWVYEVKLIHRSSVQGLEE